MTKKPTYEELERKVREFQETSIEWERAKTLLRKSGELYRNVYDTAPLAFVVWDLDTRVTDWNKKAEEVFGWSKKEALGRPFFDFLIPQKDLPYVKTVVDKLVKSKVPSYSINDNLTKSGRIITCEWNNSPLHDDERNIVGVISLALDITERNRAEKALKRTESFLQSTLDSLDGLLVVIDKNHRVVYSNWKDHKWVTEEEKKDEPHCYKVFKQLEAVCDYCPPVDTFKDGRPRIYKDRNPIDGTFKEIRVTPIFGDHGEVVNVVEYVQDITKRKQAEEALLDSEQRFRKIIDTTLEGIWVTDSSGRTTFVNQRMTDLLGYSFDEMLGKTVQEFIAEENAEIFEAKVDRQRQGISEQFDLQFCRKDGSKLFGIVSSTPMFDREGHVAGGFTMVTDVTDRMQAAEERKKLESQLRQAMKMEAIGTLAGGIAHDFNNILGAIIGYTELGVLDAPDGSRLKANLGGVLTAASRAKDLVQQILTFSRQAEQQLKPVQVSRVVKEAVKLLRASLPTTIEIHEEVKSNGVVMADPIQIHQVMMNLCTNASHAMEEKGGVLDVSLVDVELDSDFVTRHPDIKPGHYLQLTVTDTGHGMLPEILDQVFVPFYSTKDTGKGTGLGLSVVHGIVKGHGGIIYAYSDPDSGSIFKVYLPAVERRLEPEKRGEKALPKGTEHILFVDDEETLVAIGSQMLESLGYEVTTRTSSLEAYELFKAYPERFDLVITDQTMPNMTGDELARKLIVMRSDIPIILCTGFSTRMTDEKAEEMGILGFIMKPLIMRSLAEAIRKVLDKG